MLEAAKESIGQQHVGPYGFGTGSDATPLLTKNLTAVDNASAGLSNELPLSAQSCINMAGIEVWNAKGLIAEQLAKQQTLVKRSPLRWVPVGIGLQVISEKLGGWLDALLSPEQFVQTCLGILEARRIAHTLQDRNELYQVFDSIDLDRDGFLSLGEWAGGLTVYFQGTLFECVTAVFHTLDQDKDGTISQDELQEYVKPMVKAMTLEEAQALCPLLLANATESLFNEMDQDSSGIITLEKFLAWATAEQSALAYANGVVDKVAYTIDLEVYRLWIHHKTQLSEPLQPVQPSAKLPAAQ